MGIRNIFARSGTPRARPVLRARLAVEQLESRLVPYSVSGNAWPHPEMVTISFVPDGTVLGQSVNGPINSNLFVTFNKWFGSDSHWTTFIFKAVHARAR